MSPLSHLLLPRLGRVHVFNKLLVSRVKKNVTGCVCESIWLLVLLGAGGGGQLGKHI